MSDVIHEGGCLCGAVRYRVTGEPFRTNICHCTNCQKRTGSSFGISTYFKEEQVELGDGERRVYRFQSDESGRYGNMEFCANCGSTVTWTADFFAGARGIAGGSFDDPNWFEIKNHGWVRSAQKRTCFPEDVEVFEKAIPPSGKIVDS
ncbi:MAG: GFA family protein [Gammaproteobacteria bacterium]|nr:MAG: GFA family protein [Gammaproteobacteria bacterium]